MDRMVLSRMPRIEVFGILIMLGVGHDEAMGSEGAGWVVCWGVGTPKSIGGLGGV